MEGGDDLLTLARAGRTVEEVYFCEDMDKGTKTKEQLEEFKNSGIETIEVSKIAFAKASYRSAGQGIIGVVRCWEIIPTGCLAEEDGPIVVLDEVEKPGNLGAILRSAEAFGAAGVVLSDPAVDFFNPNVVRSSRGLMGCVPVAMGTKEEVFEWLQTSGRKLTATSAHATKELGEGKLAPGAAIIFGSEKSGLGEYWQKPQIEWIKIPMRGSSSSLNLHITVACLLYEYNRSVG